MELEQRARELLASNEYFNIATVTDTGRPWNTPVYAVPDEELQLYWSSWKEAVHSRNIRANSMVFMTLYDSTRKRGDNNRRCLYLEGQAIEVTDESEIRKALELLYGDEGESMRANEFLGDGLRRIYRAVPEEYHLRAA